MLGERKPQPKSNKAEIMAYIYTQLLLEPSKYKLPFLKDSLIGYDYV